MLKRAERVDWVAYAKKRLDNPLSELVHYVRLVYYRWVGGTGSAQLPQSVVEDMDGSIPAVLTRWIEVAAGRGERPPMQDPRDEPLLTFAEASRFADLVKSVADDTRAHLPKELLDPMSRLAEVRMRAEQKDYHDVISVIDPYRTIEVMKAARDLAQAFEIGQPTPNFRWML